MKKLKAPAGADGANIGTKLFPLDSDGNITVPDEDVPSLVGVGGFELVADAPVVPEGHTVMQSLNGAQSCSFGADSYSTDEHGLVTVPNSMVVELLSHGFVVAPPAPLPAPVVVDPAPAPAMDQPAQTPETPVPAPDPDPAPAPAPASAPEPPQPEAAKTSE